MKLICCLMGPAAALLLGGCASVVPLAASVAPRLGQMPADIRSQTSVGLDEGNFVLVRTNVVGESKGFSLLGLITITPPTVTEAMSRLYAAAAMEEGKPQTMAHMVVDQSSSFWILFAIPKVTVRADVVEFTSPRRKPQQKTDLEPGR
jgi:hypothetical protein